jgi:hypothetical protein
MDDTKTDTGEPRRSSDRIAASPQSNGIRMMSGRRAQGAAASAESADAERATLEAIERRFLREGREYRFPDGAAAFSDQGESLISQSENPMVVRALVDIAIARQWQSLAVSGTSQFRQAVWNQAMERGIDVKGYSPEASEKARMQSAGLRDEARERDADRPVAPEAAVPIGGAVEPPKPRRPITGELLEHGRAPYQNEADNPMSYFAKVKTATGERTVWGVDLERALRESVSAPKVGDEIVLRQVRAEPVTVRAVERGEDGEVAERSKNVLRNQWSLETRAFVESREEASRALRDASRDPKEVVRNQPQLAGAYLAVRGAEEIARSRIPHPEDQARFVDLVRTAVADGIEKGKAMLQVKLRGRERGRAASSRTADERDRGREDPEIGR